MRSLSFLFLVFLTITSLSAQVVQIPLKNVRMPSDDLLMPSGEILSVEELWQLSKDKNNPLDLSKLQPYEWEAWKDQIGASLKKEQDHVELPQNSTTLYSGLLISSPGQMRFNVFDRDTNTTYTAILEKSLHTILLRKNLLRKLGYVIPKMDYRRGLTVRFETKEEMELFLEKQLPNATLGASSRWVVKKDDQTLTVTFRDLIITKPGEQNHFNFAMGIDPRGAQTSRTIRSLIIPYTLVNVRESINKLKWHVGRIDNDAYRLPHFAVGNLNTSRDDALWALRRMAKLTAKDLEQVVALAYYPKEVELLLVQKLIARRNSLLRLFEVSHVEYVYNKDISSGSHLKDGKLLKEDWDGYASRFAHGDPDSPFQDVEYQILARVQSQAFNALTSKVAEQLTAFDIVEGRQQYFKDQFKQGLDHFVETGEILEFGVGAWWQPILNGGLIMNRNIVVGSYQGSDNIVQLADTIGFSARLGMHVGIEGLPELATAYAKGQASYLKTFTHLKPVKTLKQSLKEPYNRLFVPFVKRRLSFEAGELATILKDGDNPEDLSDDEQDRIKTILDNINEFLGIGESIITTSKLVPSFEAGVSVPVISANVALSGQASHLRMKRVHIYRQSQSEIQVYIDQGKSKSFELSFSVNKFINVLNIKVKRTTGEYDVKFHKLNINTDPEENPEIESNALALSQVLTSGSSELLNEVNKPYKIQAKFNDKSTRIKFLIIRSQSLTGTSHIELTTPEGVRTEYVSLQRNKQEGANPQDFAIEVLNYYLRKHLEGFNFNLTTEGFKNPGFTLFGSSKSVKTRFEAQVKRQQDGAYNLKKNFINVSNVQEGWTIKKHSLQRKLDLINRRFNRYIFPRDIIEDITSMKVYNITVGISFYDKAVARLDTITKKEIYKLQNAYRSKLHCDREDDDYNTYKCGNLGQVTGKIGRCKRLRKKLALEFTAKNQTNVLHCKLELATLLHQQIEFPDFINLIGEKNFYLYGTVTGFRTESEILYESERSNSVGKIGSRHVHGPIQSLQNILGIQGGEFHGRWIRETL